MANLKSFKNVVLITEPRFEAIVDRELFPNRLAMGRINWSSLDAMLLVVKLWIRIVTTKPRALFFMSVTSLNRGFDLVSTFIWIKRFGLLNNMSLIFWSHKTYSNDPEYLIGQISESQASLMQRIIIYYRSLEELHPNLRDKFEFIPMPAHQVRKCLRTEKLGDYIFIGGSAFRDFNTAFRAIDGLEIPVKVRTLGAGAENILTYNPPNNCSIEIGDRVSDQPDTYLQRIAESRFVLVPLYLTDEPKGLTTIVEAFRLGKPIITTKSLGLDDYVQHGVNSLLVDAGDIEAYRAAIKLLWNDSSLLNTLSDGARRSGEQCSCDYFNQRIKATCEEVLGMVRN